jgi:hypothetical protein
MLYRGTHMECGKAGIQASSFIAAAMGANWSQRSEINVNPVLGYNKPDTNGVGFQEELPGG